MKDFSKWEIAEVEDYFQVLPLQNHPLLNVWLANTCVISPDEERTLLELGAELRNSVHDWNEEELKMYFLSFLLKLVNYQHADYHAFFERPLAVKIQAERLAGILDCVIAMGRRVPKRPLFCLHEYKPKKHSSNDPLGQTLIAMIAAQKFNQDDEPMYGWSLAFDATKEPELRDIFKLLRFIKQMIEQRLMLPMTGA